AAPGHGRRRQGRTEGSSPDRIRPVRICPTRIRRAGSGFRLRRLIPSRRGKETPMTPLEGLDYAGVAVFAATGALAASRKQLDMIGFVFLAAVTGIGGGTFRDIVLGATPVFWVEKPAYLMVCVAVAVIVYFTAHLVESRYRLLLWLDA